jgi:hypothetical protein
MKSPEPTMTTTLENAIEITPVLATLTVIGRMILTWLRGRNQLACLTTILKNTEPRERTEIIRAYMHNDCPTELRGPHRSGDGGHSGSGQRRSQPRSQDS